jgi:hypothetical protein
MFLRHEGFLGSLGAWIKNVAGEDGSLGGVGVNGSGKTDGREKKEDDDDGEEEEKGGRGGLDLGGLTSSFGGIFGL